MCGSEEKKYYLLVKKVFRILAPVYDIGTIPISGVRDKTVDFTGAKKSSKILDIATGTGKQAFAFAKKGYDVTGIDLSEAMLGVASRKNKYANRKNLKRSNVKRESRALLGFHSRNKYKM